mgnify:CR=1 FL=1
MELIKLEYKDIILPASEYRKMMRAKLLSEHLHTIVRVLEYMQRKIERKARSGHNSCTITFYSPLHYTNSTPREIFKVISTNVRNLFVLKCFHFTYIKTRKFEKFLWNYYEEKIFRLQKLMSTPRQRQHQSLDCKIRSSIITILNTLLYISSDSFRYLLNLVYIIEVYDVYSLKLCNLNCNIEMIVYC